VNGLPTICPDSLMLLYAATGLGEGWLGCQVDEATESFCIRDAKGQGTGVRLFRRRDRPAHGAMGRLTRDEAWRSRRISPSCRRCCGDHSTSRTEPAGSTATRKNPRLLGLSDWFPFSGCATARAGRRPPGPSANEHFLADGCRVAGSRAAAGGRLAHPRKNRTAAAVIERSIAGLACWRFLAPGAAGIVLFQEPILDLGIDRVQPLLGALGFLAVGV
jgi:hypothetical protein